MKPVGKLGYSGLREVEKSSLVLRRVGWETAQGFKEWAVTAVEKCFESLTGLTR